MPQLADEAVGRSLFRRTHIFEMNSSRVLCFIMILAFLTGAGGMAFFFGPQVLENYLVRKRHLEKADAIVVMAGNREDRLPGAVRLYRQGVAPKILLANDGVFAGWSGKHQRNLYLVEWAREDLLAKGVPFDDIVLLEFTEGGSIHDALNTRDYVQGTNDIRSLVVVTSDYHTRRTLWVFQRVFAGENIKIGVYPAVAESDEEYSRIEILVREMIKYFYYRLRYGLGPIGKA